MTETSEFVRCSGATWPRDHIKLSRACGRTTHGDYHQCPAPCVVTQWSV